MKGCIVLQRQFAPIGNAIAFELKNKYNIRDFCGYILTRRAENFVRAQKDIHYTELILQEDIHNQYKKEALDIEYLKKLEAEYGLPNLWQCLAIDRTLMMDIPPKEYSVSPTPPYTHEEMLKILQIQFRTIIDFLNKEKPDFIVGVNIGSIGTMTLYHVAKRMNIKIYTVETGKIDNRVTFSENYKTLSGVEKIIKDIKENNYESPFKKEAENHLKKFRKNPAPPSFAAKEKDKNFLEKISSIPFKFFRVLKFTLRSTYKYIKNPYKSDISVENPARALINKFKRKIRGLRNLKPLYDKPIREEDFAYFPLHFEPEATTLLYAPFYTNQITLLTQIAKSLPVHFKLYVKEHPSMLEYRQTEYYKELKKIPNLKLLNPKTDSLDLIKKSKIVITITGTAGFEASLLKKPVVTFGDIFYNNLSFVKKCREIENLPNIIKQQLENSQYDNEEIINFLSAVFEDTLPFDFTDLWAKGDYEEVKNHSDFPKFVANLAKKITA